MRGLKRVVKFSLSVILSYILIVTILQGSVEHVKVMSSSRKHSLKMGTENISEVQIVQQKDIKQVHNSEFQVVKKASKKIPSGTHQKKGGWKRKISFRRKNFGRLEEWDSNPDMKRILLWTGYGPQQEGMLLWKRVFKSIGLVHGMTFNHLKAVFCSCSV